MNEPKNTEAARLEAAIGDDQSYNAFKNATQINTFSTHYELEEECRRHMKSNEIPLDDRLCLDGSVQRFSIDSNRLKKDEWYAGKVWEFKGRIYLCCNYGSWSGDRKFVFQSWKDSDTWLSSQEREELRQYVKDMERVAEEERKKRQDEAAIEANAIWDNASREPVSEGHAAYLRLKEVEPYNIRFGVNPQGYDAIILPLWHIDGRIRSLQFISVGLSDNTVYKTFLSGGEKKGCFFVIGNLKKTDSFIVAEGFSTGASIHKADGRPVVVSFDCGNFESVISALRMKYPDHQIVIAGDEDIGTQGNPGRVKAEAAAQKYNCQVVFPKFDLDLKLSNGKTPTDFNDLYVLSGPEEVKQQIKNHSIYLEREKREIQLDIPEVSTDITDITKDMSEEWGTPIELKESLLAVPPLNPLLLPEGFRQYAEDASDRMQCLLDLIAIPQLIMISSVIGAGCGVRPKQFDTWTVTPNLWGGIVGPPSIMKSPALNDVLVPLGYLEGLAKEDYEKRSLIHKVDQKELELRKKHIENNLKDAIQDEKSGMIEGYKTALLALEKEEITIPRKRYKTNDATIEKLAEILHDNPRGMLVFRDELIGFLASLDKDGREGDRAFYLEGWNGYSSSPVTSDRIKRGTTSCNPCISILGGIQPSKLRRYLFEAMNDISNDGFLQRFQMLIYPDIPKNFKLIDRKPDAKARERVKKITVNLAETDFLSMGAAVEENYPFPIVRFDLEAQEFFYSWYTELRMRLITDVDQDIFIEHLGKYAKLMPSLALIFHLINVADGRTPSSISLEEAIKAAELCKYLEAHATRIYAILEHKGVVGGKLLLKRLKSGDLANGFTQRDVYKKGWSGLTGLKDAEESCEILVAKGWLKEETAPTTSKGGAPTIRYRIHPKLLKMAKESTDTTDKTKEE